MNTKDTECGYCGTDHDSRKECPQFHAPNQDRTEEFCKKLEALIGEALAAGVDGEWLLETAERVIVTEEDSE